MARACFARAAPSPFFSRLGFASPREKALSHEGRGDYAQRFGFPLSPCGRGLRALASEASLGAKGEGARA
jgi:hypothetical protein